MQHASDKCGETHIRKEDAFGRTRDCIKDHDNSISQQEHKIFSLNLRDTCNSDNIQIVKDVNKICML